jgi:hypothetical protein
MLVVISTDQVRARSPFLLNKFNEMHRKCNNDLDYCMRKSPIQRLFRAPTGTKARLAVKAKDMVDKNNMRGKLTLHKLEPGKSYHESPGKEVLENLDAFQPR